MDATSRPYALLMHKGSVAPGSRAPEPAVRARRDTVPERFAARAARPTRGEVLRRIVDATPEQSSVVIATTGYTGRELAAIADRANQLYMVGSMGCAASLGLGVALARPDLRVVVVDGDGAALMRLGNFATLGAYGGSNLIHLLLDNEVHESTGGQPTVSGGLSFAGIAAACGYGMALEGDGLELLDPLFAARGGEGPRFGALKIRAAAEREPPRPALSPEQVRTRFSEHLEKLAGAAAGTRR
jgi:phosphonopyruvate decarboxylase